jgi:hypothetical protein
MGRVLICAYPLEQVKLCTAMASPQAAKQRNTEIRLSPGMADDGKDVFRFKLASQ